jgi:hypothetical protein
MRFDDNSRIPRSNEKVEMSHTLKKPRMVVAMLSLTLATIVVPVIFAPTPAAAAACKSTSFSQIQYDPVFTSSVAWRETAGAYWCYSTGSNPHLISVTWSRSAKALCCGWDFEKWSGTEKGGCWGHDWCHYAFRRVTAQFSYEPLGVSLYRVYPYIQFTVRDDGSCSFGSSSLGGPYNCPS